MLSEDRFAYYGQSPSNLFAAVRGYRPYASDLYAQVSVRQEKPSITGSRAFLVMRYYSNRCGEWAYRVLKKPVFLNIPFPAPHHSDWAISLILASTTVALF